MSKRSASPVIRLRGVRQHNLKNIDLDLPLGRLIVVTGLSGSGKSSLAFDTLFAEGQRRYVETFSPYARQFFDRMDKPAADRIDGIPPAIAIEQRNAVKTTRSTVGTMTEICDYMKSLWPHLAQLHCRGCGKVVRKESPQEVWQVMNSGSQMPDAGGQKPDTEFLITFKLLLSEKLSLDESLALIAKQGYQRLLLDGEIVRLADLESGIRHPASEISHLTVIQDRLKLTPSNRARFIEACEQAYHFGKGKLTVFECRPAPESASPFTFHVARPFSNHLHCADCDLEYRDPSPALFSFNHPVGACPSCKGFGRTISIDYNLAVPDRSLTLAQGVVKPWRGGFSAECQEDLMEYAAKRRVPTKVPFHQLPQQWQDWVILGEPGYGQDKEHEWPHAWYGVKGYFRWLESKSYKMHVRVLLSRYRAYETCCSCQGDRFQPDALLFKVLSNTGAKATPAKPSSDSQVPVSHSSLSLADFYRLPIRDAFRFIEELAARHRVKTTDPIGIVLNEVRSRLGYLVEVGLGYITLDRPTRSLSGGETERVSLTTCLGTRLVNTLFVLDEPSVGLHPRDTARLVTILQRLRDTGNTVVVVEHEAAVIRAADQVVDLGPGHGESGGHVVFQGPFAELLKAKQSLTGQYLSGRKTIEVLEQRPVTSGSRPHAASGPKPLEGGTLTLQHASCHNLKDLTVEIPLKRFVCLTGVSGSGKTTLAREVLLPALDAKLKSQLADSKSDDAEDAAPDKAPATKEDSAPASATSASLTGWETINQVVLVDQSSLGKTPRSNPAVYTGAFDDIREVFAQSEVARQRGLNASAFSFNSAQGQCARCRGAGFEKIEMQFLSDVFIRCPECNGRRYREHILEVKVESRGSRVESQTTAPGRARKALAPRPSSLDSPWSIADLLDATVDEAIIFLDGFPDSRPAQRAVASLRLLQEVGLGYLRVGQPINTLSGGESQRLKLVRHLAEAVANPKSEIRNPKEVRSAKSDQRRDNGLPSDLSSTLFLFDEPTTGLHFDDVRVLLQVFQRLVNAGHSVLVIEHNLDVIKCADWIIDLGPDAGDEGGQIVAAGTPKQIAACAASHTGRALRSELRIRSSP